MDLRTELRYDAGVEDVFAMLCAEEFREQVCQATLARSYDVSVDTRDDVVDVRISRQLPAPDVARKLVGDTMEVVQVERWAVPAADGTRTAALSVEIPGKPGSMRGSVVLAAAGAGACETITGEIKVKIPVVGAKLEREIHRALLSAIRAEGKVGSRWLAG